MKTTIALLLLLLALLNLAQAGYQERAIFLGRHDCPCTSQYRNWENDDVYLEIEVEDKPTIKGKGLSTTMCLHGIMDPQQALIPSQFISWVVPGMHKVFLTDEARYVYLYGQLKMVIVNTTLKSAVLFGRVDYDCMIMGDEEIQHWGINFDKYKPATVHIRCLEPREYTKKSIVEQTQ